MEVIRHAYMLDEARHSAYTFQRPNGLLYLSGASGNRSITYFPLATDIIGTYSCQYRLTTHGKVGRKLLGDLHLAPSGSSSSDLDRSLLQCRLGFEGQRSSKEISRSILLRNFQATGDQHSLEADLFRGLLTLVFLHSLH